MARRDIAYAMNSSDPGLPPGYGFNDLASYEENRRRLFGKQYGQKVADYTTQFTSDAAKRRAALAGSLSSSGQSFFKQNNPALLEDLNSRGLLSSPTAVANSESEALKQIDLANQDKLNAFDTQSYADENSLKLAGLTGDLQSQQDALDAGLNLRSSDLESRLQEAQSSREEALANSLANKQGRNSLYGSLIGAGGSLGAAYLGAKALGGTGLLGIGTAGTTIPAATGAGVGGIPLASAGGTAPAAGIGLGGAAAIGGAGVGAALLSRAAQKRVGGATGNAQLGTAAGVLANPIGAQLNLAKNLVTNPSQTLSRALGSKKSNGTGSGDATATEQRQLDSELSQLQQLKSTLSPEEYQAQAQPMIDQISQRVGGLTSRNSAWANAINPNWKKFQDAGIVAAKDGRWMAV